VTLKPGGLSVDDSDLLINEITETRPKGNVLWNGSVENCNPESDIRTLEAVSIGRCKADILNGFGALAALEISSCTPYKEQLQIASVSACDTSCKVQGTSPDFHSPSDFIQSSCALRTSSDDLQSTGGQNAAHVLRVADQPSDPSAPFVQEVLLDSAPLESSQHVAGFATHNRSLSQTTSQLTNLKESIKFENFEDICHVSNLLQESHVKKLPDTYPSDKSRMKDLPDVPSSESLIVDKSHVSLSDSSDFRTVQDLTNCERAGGSDVSSVSENTLIGSSADPCQCYSLESEVDLPYFTHSPYPNWKLDRRGSGHLFWRRDSSTLNGTDPSSRVKFRYDIEVHEFESRSSGGEDLAEDEDDDDDNAYYYYDDDDVRVRNVDGLCASNSQTVLNDEDESSPLGSTALMCVVAVTAIIVMASYRWALGVLSLI
jgi:hypothetical protein